MLLSSQSNRQNLCEPAITRSWAARNPAMRSHQESSLSPAGTASHPQRAIDRATVHFFVLIANTVCLAPSQGILTHGPAKADLIQPPPRSPPQGPSDCGRVHPFHQIHTAHLQSLCSEVEMLRVTFDYCRLNPGGIPRPSNTGPP